MKIHINLGRKLSRKIFLLLGQILFPGLSHLIVKRWSLGIAFLLLWGGSWYVYICYRLTNFVLYPVPIAATIHLLCIREFWDLNGGTSQGLSEHETE